MLRTLLLVVACWIGAPGLTLAGESPLADSLAQGLVTGAKGATGSPAVVMVTRFAGDNAAAVELQRALSRALVSRGVKVVDSESLLAAGKEGALRASGLAEGDLREVAGASGATLVVVGTLSLTGERTTASARLIRAVDGVVLASASADGDATTAPAPSDESGDVAAQVRRLGDRLATGLDGLPGDSRYQRFAVLPFEASGPSASDKQLGTLVSAELTTSLSRDHGLLMVERGQLARVLDELALGQTGLTDDKTSLAVGKLAGAQGLVVGSVSDAGDKYLVNARVVSVSDGRVLAAQSVTLPAAELIALSSDAVVLRTRSGAIYRSILMPGWGAFYNREPTKGVLFTAAELAAGGLALGAHLMANRDRNDYLALGAGAGARYDELRSSASNGYTWRNRFLWTLLAVHALGVLDAALSGRSYDSAFAGSAGGR